MLLLILPVRAPSFARPIMDIDDSELRLDAAGKAIHVRSASRVGKGDLGVNRKRVERLRNLFRTRHLGG